MPPKAVTNHIHQFVYDVTVIGGGFAGAFTALELVKKGYTVLHIDKDSTILGMSSSSFNECYKLHTGVHYLGDTETARQCLLGSIEFAREFSDFIEGKPSDPWRKGRHYVVSNSLYEPEQLCIELQKLYEAKVAENRKNAVFGDPKDFIKYLEPTDYPHVAKQILYVNDGYSFDVMYEITPQDKHINPNKLYLFLSNNQIKYKALNQLQKITEGIINDDDLPETEAIKIILRSNGEKELTLLQKKSLFTCTSTHDPSFSEQGTTEYIHVKLGIETPESQINIEKLRAYLQSEFGKHHNYTFVSNNGVKNIAFESGTLNYVIGSVHMENGKTTTYTSKGVVNCAWHNIEALDRQIGYVPNDAKKGIKNNRIIRPKISLLITLPASLQQANTCIFSCGPHMSFTNLANGTAVLTYEPVTNCGSYPAGTVILSDELQALYKDKLMPEKGKGKEFAEKIIEGAARYIPDLKHPDCIVKEVRLGHVKIFVEEGKSYSLSAKDSAIHGRKEDGVEQNGLCYVSHSGMKMTYTKKGAEKVVKILETHFFTRKQLLQRNFEPTEALSKFLETKTIRDFYNLILYNIFRNFLVETTKKCINATSPDSIEGASAEVIDTQTKKHIIEGIQKKSDVVSELNHICNEISQEGVEPQEDHCIAPSKVKSFLSTPT